MRHSIMAERMAGSGSDKWQLHWLAQQRTAAGHDVLMLTIGEPDFPAPDHVVDTAIASLRAGRTGYTSGRGEGGVLDAIVDKFTDHYGRAITRDQVIIVSGTQNGLSIAMYGTVDPGDDVLVPDPYYATYEGVIQAAGGTVVPVRLDPDEAFHLNVDVLRSCVTPESRALLLNTPHNPTGATLRIDEIEAIAEVCVEHDLWVVSDEVYADHTYDGVPAPSMLDVPGMAERTIVTGSLSKSHAMPGFRTGWIVASEEAVDALLPVAESMLFGTQPFLQDAAAAALRDDMTITKDMRETFRRRAEVMCRTIDGAGVMKAAMPEAGMFVMADVRETGLSGIEFAKRMLEATDVAVMPGESFGLGGAGHIRISMTVADEVVGEAASRIAGFARSLATRQVD